MIVLVPGVFIVGKGKVEGEERRNEPGDKWRGKEEERDGRNEGRLDGREQRKGGGRGKG